MIARGDLARMRERHILDSLRAAVAVPPGARVVLDLGSGAGLPGVPLAIARPGLRVILAESRHQRIAFLELVARDLRLANVSVHAGRAEDAPHPVDACLARAFRNASDSWTIARSLLSDDGCLLYYAGARFDEAHDIPEGSVAQLVPPPPLANAGPLVIMTRQ